MLLRVPCSNLLAGKSGISQIERWDPNKFELTTTIAGEIKGTSAAARSRSPSNVSTGNSLAAPQISTPPAG
jgi:3-oxoacyl-(acyl-carrier-protein) synthase